LAAEQNMNPMDKRKEGRFEWLQDNIIKQ
jgi:hypothetical protein